jgi:hypothetical protein
MNHKDFDFGIIYGTIYFNLHFLPAKVTPFFNLLAFLNGGLKDEDGAGYWFASDQGLVHFAFLTGNQDCQAKWRLQDFEYHQQLEFARRDAKWF